MELHRSGDGKEGRPRKRALFKKALAGKIHRTHVFAQVPLQDALCGAEGYAQEGSGNAGFGARSRRTSLQVKKVLPEMLLRKIHMKTFLTEINFRKGDVRAVESMVTEEGLELQGAGATSKEETQTTSRHNNSKAKEVVGNQSGAGRTDKTRPQKIEK